MKEFNLRELIDVIITSYFAGIIYVLLGIWIIKYTINNPSFDRSSPLQGDMSGFGAGILLILAGVLLFYYKFFGK
jgi:uncharacterized membrane protein HdeD (DUF308 family)